MCPLCTRKCSNSQKLKTHMGARHQEVTSYQYTTCGKSFGDSFTLKKHMSRATRSHHPLRCWSAEFVARGVILQVIWFNRKGITLEKKAPVASICHNLDLFLLMNHLARRTQPTLKHPGRSNTPAQTAIKLISTGRIWTITARFIMCCIRSVCTMLVIYSTTLG